MTSLTNIYLSIAQVPDGDAKAPGDLGNALSDLIGYAKYVAFGICVLALIGAAVTMAFSRQRGGDSSEAASGIVKPLVATAIVAGAAGLVGLFV